jgi:uncharacterized protein YciI
MKIAVVFAAFPRTGLPSGTMRNPAPFLLAVLLFAGLPLCAQAPSPSTGPTAAAPAPAMKSWFIRLVPRPTFLKDMTGDEKRVMDEHYVYWKELFDKGVCVFGGPVLDPQGVFGVLAVRAATEDEARALAAGDPSVKAGINKIEVAEMRIAFLPKVQ